MHTNMGGGDGEKREEEEEKGREEETRGNGQEKVEKRNTNVLWGVHK